MALSLLYDNREKYVNILRQHTQEADSSTNGDKQLHLYSEPARIRIATTTWTHPTGQTDIVYPSEPEKSEDREEVVLRLQGYVLRANLPPITSQSQLTKNPSAAKQSLVLTGLGYDVFENGIKAVLALHSRFASLLPSGSLEAWQPVADQGDLCLEFTNRYHTPDHLAVIYDSATADEIIDPLGLLREKAGGRRTEDNIVLYYERQPTHNNTFRYIKCSPVQIKVGHLVEAQVSLCAVPISRGRHLMLLKLRSVCILDQVVQKDLNEVVFESLKVRTRADNKKLKRKVGYEDTIPRRIDDSTIAMKRLRLESGTSGDLVDGQPLDGSGKQGQKGGQEKMSTD